MTGIESGMADCENLRGRFKVVVHCLCACVVVTLLSACTTTSPAQPFADVQQSVDERSGYELHWSRLEPGAAEIQTALDDLLARELTPDSAVQIALLNNRRLQAEYGRLGLAQAELVQAGLLKNPVFHGSIRWAPRSQRIFDFSIVQDFLDILLLRLETSVAQNELEGVKLEVTGRVIDFAADVKREFFAYVAHEELIDVSQSILLAAESSFEMARQLHDAGNITALDVLNEQVAYERAKLDLARVEARRVIQRERLNRLMGLWGDETDWTSIRDLPALPEPQVESETVEQRALAASLELARAYTELEIAAQRFRVTEIMQIIPQFHLGGSVEFEKEETFELVERRRRDGSKYELKEVPGPTEVWSGGEASIGIPLFDQGQAARAAGRAEIERRYERYTALAIEVRSAAREAAFRAANAQARAKYYAQVFVPLHETITAETQLRYNAMFDGVFQLLRAKTNELEARHDYVEALHDYWVAHADLEQLLMGQVPKTFRESMRSDRRSRPQADDGQSPLGGNHEQD